MRIRLQTVFPVVTLHKVAEVPVQKVMEVKGLPTVGKAMAKENLAQASELHKIGLPRYVHELNMSIDGESCYASELRPSLCFPYRN